MGLTGYSDLKSLWREVKPILDRRLLEIASLIDGGRHVDVIKYIVAGGKRLRGLTTILVGLSLGSSMDEVMDAAIAIELVHSASLAIDDVIDGDVVRRGAPAAWLKFGPGKAILAANLLVSYAHKMLMERYGFQAVKRTIKAWYDITRGEVRDAYTDEEDYLQIARLKTGTLFRLAAELAAVAAKAPEHIVDIAGEYGELVGLMYQIADDAVDARKGSNDPSVKRLIRWLSSQNIVSAALDKIKAMLIRVVNLVEELRPRRFKKLLIELPMFAVKAMFEEAGLNVGF